MGREILIDGESKELTKEAILSLRGMQLLEFFLRVGEEPSLLLILDPGNEALVLGLEEHVKKNEGFSKDESKKVFQAVFLGVSQDNLESWLEGLIHMSDDEVHSWCDSFTRREGLQMKDQSSHYNFYTDMQVTMLAITESIMEERDRRGNRSG